MFQREEGQKCYLAGKAKTFLVRTGRPRILFAWSSLEVPLTVVISHTKQGSYRTHTRVDLVRMHQHFSERWKYRLFSLCCIDGLYAFDYMLIAESFEMHFVYDVF